MIWLKIAGVWVQGGSCGRGEWLGLASILKVEPMEAADATAMGSKRKRVGSDAHVSGSSN